LFKELIAEIGVKGVWNDMNEPAVMVVPTKTFPLSN
jgi:alpha-glucosidase